MRKIAVYEQCLSDRKMMNFYPIFTLVPSKFQVCFEVFGKKKMFFIFCHFWLKLGNFSKIKFFAEVANFILLNLHQK